MRKHCLHATILAVLLALFLLASTAALADDGSLTTTFAGGNGCYNGNMFNLTAKTDLTITGFDLSFRFTAPTSVAVYFRSGGYNGFETTPGAWTLLGSYPVSATTNPFHIDIAPLPIAAGNTYGIYVDFYAGYSTGTAVYENDEIKFEGGVGLCSLFGGLNVPRVWNGTVYYTFGIPEPDAAPDAAPDAFSPALNLLDGRLNDHQAFDIAAPIVLYENEGAVDIYSVNPELGTGVFTFRILPEDVAAAGLPAEPVLLFSGVNTSSGQPLDIYVLPTGELAIHTFYADGKPYIIVWDPANPDGMYHAAA